MAIITTEPNEVVSPIHDRMPVILHQDEENDRMNLEKSEDELKHFLQPIDDKFLTSWRVSQKVNSTRNTGKELIEKIS